MVRRIWSSANSVPSDRMNSGSPISHTSRPGRGSSTWLSSSMSFLVASSAGASLARCTPIWSWMHSSRRCGLVLRSRVWCTTATGAGEYLSIRYSERLAEAGIDPSEGSVGDSYDNALAESIIGLYKSEVIDRRGPWRNLDDVEYATLAWVDWFNNRRLLESIGNLPPAEFEMMYYRQLDESATAA
jgi:putative transposase